MSIRDILLVDGDPSVLASLTALLGSEGYRVRTAQDGLAGWQAFQSEKPDLVILDVLLPKLSGFELCERIGRSRAAVASHLPIIVVSDFTKEADWMFEPLKASGLAATFSKPVHHKDLLAALAKLGQEKLEERAAPEAPPPSSPPPADNIVIFPGEEEKSKPVRLFLADDNPVTRQIIQRAFSREGFEVSLAAEGREAERSVEGFMPDVALLDVNLPGLSGYDLRDLILATPSLAGATVIYLREPFEKIDLERMRTSPAQGLLLKPLKSAEWVRQVRDIMKKKA